MRLALVRHGQTELNKKLIIQGGITNFPLNDTGKNELLLTAKYFLNTNSKYELIASSALSRAIESALIIKDVLNDLTPLTIFPKLNERNYGVFEMKKIAFFYDHKDDLEYRNDYESDLALKKRIADALLEIYRSFANKNMIICAHSQVIKTALILAGAPKYNYKSLIKNGSITILEISEKKIRFISHHSLNKF